MPNNRVLYIETFKCSLLQPTDLLVLSQICQRCGEAVGSAQGIGVVLAQDPAAAGEGVLAELTSLFVVL